MKIRFLVARKILLLVIAPVFFNSACSRYTFAPKGFIVNGDPTYYNEEMKLTVSLYGDHANYRKKDDLGFRTYQLYKTDKKILKKVNLLPKDVEVLFSGKPIFDPFYNFLGLINKGGQQVHLDASFRKKFDRDSIVYFYKTFLLKDKRVYYTVIPYRDMQLSFVYYQGRNDSCTYCDIEGLSLQNAKRIRDGQLYVAGSEKDYSAVTGDDHDVRITIPEKRIVADRQALVKIYNDSTMRLTCFSIIDKGLNNTDVHLGKGKYTVLYTDFANKLHWKNKLIVE